MIVPSPPVFLRSYASVARIHWVMCLATLLMVPILASDALAGAKLNDFDLSEALIPTQSIESGGPGRDGIPALDRPRFIAADDAGFLKPSDRVLGIYRNGITRAYPVAILNWHEIVNDHYRGEPVAVTYCPLCGTGMAFIANVGGKHLDFGVSGLLYNSDVLLYDRLTESLWSQLLHQAVTGPLRGQKLDMIPLAHTTWEDWRARHPATEVLSTDTGFDRDYGRDPYQDYARSGTLWFSVPHRDARHHAKEPVIGVRIDGTAKAYPFSALARTDGEMEDSIAGRSVIVRYDEGHRTGSIHDAASGDELPSVIAYWFAWRAFYPDTAVFEIGQAAPTGP